MHFTLHFFCFINVFVNFDLLRLASFAARVCSSVVHLVAAAVWRLVILLAEC